MSGLDWTLSIHDKISAPAKAAAGALRASADALLGNDEAAKKAQSAADRLAESKKKLAAASRAMAAAAKAESDAIAKAQAASMAAHDKAAARIRSDALKGANYEAKAAFEQRQRLLDNMVAAKGRGRFDNGRSLETSGAAPSLAARGIQALTKALGPGAIDGVKAFADAYDRLSPVLSKVAGPAMAAASALLALGGIGVGLAVGATRLLYGAQAFKGDVMFAFEKITGTKAAAVAAYDKAAKTSFDTGGDLKESLSSMNALLAQGFKADFADSLLRSMADLKTLNPQANLAGITRAISQIKTTGKLQGDELMQLAEAGLNVQSVYEQIAKSQGITAKGGQTAVQQVQKLQSAGKISSDVAIKAIMDSIRAQTGRAPGELAKEKADTTLPGAIARAENLKDQLLAGAKVDWSPVSRAIGRLNAALQAPAAKRFFDAVGTQLSRVFHLLDGVSSKDISSVFDSAASAVTGLGDAIAFAWKWGGVLGPSLSAAASMAQPLWQALLGTFTWMKTEVDAVTAAAKWIGSAVSSAIGPVNSLTDAFRAAAAAAEAVAGASHRIEAGAGGGIAGKAAAGGIQSILFGAGGGLIGARANGGPVTGGAPYVVGEEGPELFVPRGSGAIVPNDMMARVGRAGERMGQSVTSHIDSSRKASIGTVNYYAGGRTESVEDALREVVQSWA